MWGSLPLTLAEAVGEMSGVVRQKPVHPDGYCPTVVLEHWGREAGPISPGLHHRYLGPHRVDDRGAIAGAEGMRPPGAVR